MRAVNPFRFIRPLRFGVVFRMAIIALFAGSPTLAGEFYTLSGHGGPVKAIDMSPDGKTVLTASFDYTVGLWRSRTPVWLEGHNASVNSVRIIDQNTVASGGDDFDILIWNLATGTARRLGGHRGKIIALAVSPDKLTLASASWDGTIGLWDLDGNKAPRFLRGHSSNVNAVAFSGDGREIYSASADGTIRLWDTDSGTLKHVILRHGFGINTLVVNEGAGWLAYGAVDGGTRFVDIGTGRVIADMTLDRRPILAMDLAANAPRLAVGDGHGYIMIVNTDTLEIEFDFHAARRGPIWALKFTPDGQNILAGGLDEAVFSWPVDSASKTVQLAAAEPDFLKRPEAMENGERQFKRKCSICHALTPGDSRRAGPSLHGVFGRKAGSLPGYAYSAAMRTSTITWSSETIDALFELGPDHYAPGSKMPMQRIARKEDRTDLIGFLQDATGP